MLWESQGWFWPPLFASAILKRLSFLLQNNAGQLLSDISLKPVRTPLLFANEISCLPFLIHIFIYFLCSTASVNSILLSLRDVSNRGGAEESKRKTAWAAVKLHSCLSKCCSRKNFTHWGSASSWVKWSILMLQLSLQIQHFLWDY